MAKSIIDEEQFLKHLKKHFNDAMIRAAEPLIEEALKKIEAEMKKELGSYLIGFIDSNLVMERMGTDLRIIINQAFERK